MTRTASNARAIACDYSGIVFAFMAPRSRRHHAGSVAHRHPVALAPRQPGPPATPHSRPRCSRFDVLLGATIAAMAVVDPGYVGRDYSWLRHAEWDGWTPADLIFPIFLFTIGREHSVVASPLELDVNPRHRSAHHRRRAAALGLSVVRCVDLADSRGASANGDLLSRGSRQPAAQPPATASSPRRHSDVGRGVPHDRRTGW